jgi:hypothetical protein
MATNRSEESSSGLVTRPLDDTLEDAEELEVDNEIKVKYRGAGKIYDKKQTFPDEVSARDAISERYQNNLWSIKQNVRNFKTNTIWYNCSHKQCPVRLKGEILATGEVEISISRDEHQHPEDDVQPKSKTIKSISQATKDKIIDLERLGTRPKRILIELREGGLDIPTTSQLANFLKSYRRKEDGPASSTLSDIKNWCEQRLAIPDDDDMPFVVDYEISAIPDQSFKIFITTKRLVTFTRYVSIFHKHIHIFRKQSINTFYSFRMN